jgi:REP element-mobilizing transposase RayT
MMPKERESVHTGNFYHVYNRGNNRQTIFFERENYLYFLRLIKQHLIGQDIEIIAYCLMPNHYHLLVYLNGTTLTQLMKSLSLAYTKALNKRHDRVGSLFQGRFQSVHVSNTAYLVHLSRYIHLNPVKAHLVEQLAAWEFSSYLEYAGLRQGKIPKLDYLKALIGGEQAYQQFLDDHQLPDSPGFKKLLLDE